MLSASTWWFPQGERDVHALLVVGVFALGVVTFMATTVITAPYGRHVRSGWGPSLPNRVGWIVMEAPSALFFAFVYSRGEHCWQLTPLMAAALWLLHYSYRAFVYPFLIRSDARKRMPLVVVLAGDSYNVLNSYINARFLSEFGDYSADTPLARPSFWLGATMFAVGLALNIQSDHILIHLRKPSDSARYVVPYGGMFELVSCPNYLGELLEWTGWALLTESPAGLSFAFYTASNLIPRALSNHRWYQTTFDDKYSRMRRAIIPWVL
ncbi:TPA: hypothetical protein N0F65_011913 [Lagenidium giganteum]|uniref:3-oxo-5-alpha-steroid 4-dehydrogenase C-terminal domain-containing protein n=1 Tax=Lagenidium giganteum TaxID=4803 RepID=A0AAV2YUN9_9STRA|nr:TPA: hypothetical protein N0F65_011913 [Lagenidium giganteum]